MTETKPRGSPPSRGVVLAACLLVAVAALVLALVQGQRGLYTNGPLLVDLWRRGVYIHGHALLMPLARLVAVLGLAGTPAQADVAMRIVSATGGALLTGLVAWHAVRRAGLQVGLALALVVMLAPVVRFYSTAVETRALAAGCTALAVVCALRATRRPGTALALTAGGAALACSAHTGLVSAMPGLVVLHLAAEARAGRPANLRAAVNGGLAVAAALIVTAVAVLLADRLWNPSSVTGTSIVVGYLRSTTGWLEAVGRPSFFAWLAAEALAPLGVLVLLAALGIVPAWRTARLETAGHVLLVVSVGFMSWLVGARVHGGYLLPAAMSLACLATQGLLHVRRAGARSAMLGLLAFLLLACGLAVSLDGAARAAFSTPTGLAWRQDAAELSLAWAGPLPEPLVSVPMGVWLLASLAVMLLAGVVRSARATAWGAAALLLVALAWQLAAGERFRPTWPSLGNEEVRRWAEAARHDVAEGDLLLAATSSPHAAWMITYFGPRWLDLHRGDRAPAESARWLVHCEEEVEATRARGDRVVVAEDCLPLMDSPARAALARWEESGPLWRWSQADGLRK